MLTMKVKPYTMRICEMSSKNTMMRAKSLTIRVVNIIAGEIQAETGKTVSANDAIMEFVKLHRPDIIEKAQGLEAQETENEVD